MHELLVPVGVEPRLSQQVAWSTSFSSSFTTRRITRIDTKIALCHHSGVGNKLGDLRGHRSEPVVFILYLSTQRLYTCQGRSFENLLLAFAHIHLLEDGWSSMTIKMGRKFTHYVAHSDNCAVLSLIVRTV